MRKQFDFTHAQLRKSVRQAQEAYDKAIRHHRGRKAAWLILNACMTALLKYETTPAKPTRQRKAA